MRSEGLLGPLPRNDSDNCQWTIQSDSVLRELKVVYSTGSFLPRETLDSTRCQKNGKFFSIQRGSSVITSTIVLEG
jgi:hypothetical protein